MKSEDTGIKVAKKSVGGQVELTFSGTAKGPTMSKPDNVRGDFYGAQPQHKVVSLDVALSEAPTTEIAEDFAKDINSKLLAFRAQVVPGPTADSAKLVITRR